MERRSLNFISSSWEISPFLSKSAGGLYISLVKARAPMMLKK
jgi:hypothetical protein